MSMTDTLIQLKKLYMYNKTTTKMTGTYLKLKKNKKIIHIALK